MAGRRRDAARSGRTAPWSWSPTGSRSTRSPTPTAARAGSAAPAGWSPRWSRSWPAAAAPGWAGRARPARRPEPFESGGMSLIPVALTEDEVDRYYEGMSNASLWPLYHDVVEKPEYHRTWWDTYVQVNKRFAERAAAVAAENAIVWVHDYQLQLVPALLRQQRPDLTIGFFLHIPFPPYELFTQLPWRSAIVEGLLGADLVGFQRPGRGVELRPARPPAARPARPRPRWSSTTAARSPPAPSRSPSTSPRSTSWPARPRCWPRAEEIRKELGNPRKIILGRRPAGLHQGHRRPAGRVRGAARGRRRRGARTPSWSRWPRRAASGSSTTCTCARRSSSRSATSTASSARSPGPAVHYFNQSMPREELAALYRAADVMLVTPVPRRHEPGGQGVRRRPRRPRRRAGALGVRRRGRRAQAGVPGQPARHRRA